jgi:hypothetical protein
MAMNSAGFDLKGIALRTEHDPVQLLWERGEHLEREADPPEIEAIREAMAAHLAARGEPARYMILQTTALLELGEGHAQHQRREDFDGALKRTQSLIESALGEDGRFVHYSAGEGIETGLWGLSETPPIESLADRVEIALVNYLQKNPDSIYLEIENELYHHFAGLLTPSKALIYAILNSYAEKHGANWSLRPEDVAATRQNDVRVMSALAEAIGQRLRYETRKQEKWVIWEEHRNPARVFYTLASALVGRAIASNPQPGAPAILVVPGGRAALIAYKQRRDPSLAERMQAYRITKYRAWRTISQLPLLTRETFEEQLSSDPVEQAEGQMMMF